MNELKRKRLEALLSVRELSERSGVSQDTITKIENGHRRGRGLTLRKLYSVLNGGGTEEAAKWRERAQEAELENGRLKTQLVQQYQIVDGLMRENKLLRAADSRHLE